MGIETFPWAYFIVLAALTAGYVGMKYYKKSKN